MGVVAALKQSSWIFVGANSELRLAERGGEEEVRERRRESLERAACPRAPRLDESLFSIVRSR